MFIETRTIKLRIRAFLKKNRYPNTTDTVKFVFRTYIEAWQSNPNLGLSEFLINHQSEMFPLSDTVIRIPKNM